MFERLADYKRKNGNCQISRNCEDKKLENWVSLQRKSIHSISPEKKQKLDSIDFIWSEDKNWGLMFERLLAFKAKFGHCEVPLSYEADLDIGNWVCNQRTKKNFLSLEKKQKLDDVGFVWSKDQNWSSMFERLLAYKARHGDCLVPWNYEEDKSLANWVSRQRQCKNSMSLEKKQKLDNVGFIWIVRNKHNWTTMFESLLAYKLKYGNCRVPRSYEDKKLVNWVKRHRSCKNSISPEKKRQLDDIGFIWVVKKRKLS